MTATIPIVVISQGWPCWLSTILSLKLPLQAVFVPPDFREAFVCFGVDVPWRGLDDWEDLSHWPSDWSSHTILGSGAVTFVHTILSKLKVEHDGVLLFATDVIVCGCHPRDIWGSLH